MGLVNPRAICPNCGGKIHTQGGLLGDVFGHRTGLVCQHCGVGLTGKVGRFSNVAELAPTPAPQPQPTRPAPPPRSPDAGPGRSSGDWRKRCRYCGASGIKGDADNCPECGKPFYGKPKRKLFGGRG